MAQTQNTDNIKCGRECGATRTLIHYWCNANGIATLEESLVTSYKTTHTLTIWSSDCAVIHPN